MTQKNEVRIVPMDARHIAGVAALERACFSAPWSEQMLADELRNDCARYLIAECAGAVVGYVGVHQILDECYMTNLAVAPDARRRGVASLLLTRLLDMVQGAAFLTLEVRVSNAPAIALYERFGFARAGLRRAYYTAPREDALLMTRALQRPTKEEVSPT